MSNKFALFVHPRLHIFTYVMVGCVVMILCYMICLLGEKKAHVAYSLPGVLSVLLVIAASFHALNAHLDPSIVPVADMSHHTKQTTISDKVTELGWTLEANSDMGLQQEQAFVIKPVERNSEGQIVLTQSSYYGTVTELYTRPDVYLGETIKVPGIVYAAQDDGDNEFGVGLYYMTCCAADAQIVGIKMSTAGAVPHPGQRVEVVGTLQRTDTGKPILAVDSLVPIPPMEDPYMYY